MGKTKTFQISQSLVDEIRGALLAYIGHIDEECAKSGCMCDLHGSTCSQWIKDVLYGFDTEISIEKDGGNSHASK